MSLPPAKTYAETATSTCRDNYPQESDQITSLVKAMTALGIGGNHPASQKAITIQKASAPPKGKGKTA